MADLFPGKKLDLQSPVSSESPDWLGGFPQHAKRLRPIVSGLERVKTSSVGMMEHVAIVRDLAKWLDSLFLAETPPESCVELHCVHRGMRTNCVTAELYFQVGGPRGCARTLTCADNTPVTTVCSACTLRPDRRDVDVSSIARNSRPSSRFARGVCTPACRPAEVYAQNVSRARY